MKELIEEFLEKIGLKEEADSLKNGATQLNLSGKKIDEQRARELAEALKVNKSLTKIYLAWNSISETGAVKLAEALEGNKTLMVASSFW